MLQTNFQGHRPFGSREDDFFFFFFFFNFWFLLSLGMTAILGL